MSGNSSLERSIDTKIYPAAEGAIPARPVVAVEEAHPHPAVEVAEAHLHPVVAVEEVHPHPAVAGSRHRRGAHQSSRL